MASAFLLFILEVLTIAKFDHQLNEEIRDKEIRLIGADGAQLGIVSSAEANAMAEEQGMDLVMITADHGCDPAYTATTDHTREYVPLLMLGKGVKSVNLGTRASFADIAATVAELLNVELDTPGESFAKEILK